METKRCTVCGRELPIEEFGSNRASKDGKSCWCKECTRKKQKESFERRKAAAKQLALEKIIVPLRGQSDSPLAGFTPRQLMEELKSRGYSGKLTYTNVIDIDKL